MERRRFIPDSNTVGIAAFAVGVIVLAWVATLRVCEREIANDIDNAFSDGTNLSRFYADGIGRTFKTADRLVRRVKILRRRPAFNLTNWMRTGEHDALDEMSGIFIADMSGHVTVSEGAPPREAV